jgi:maltoporin
MKDTNVHLNKGAPNIKLKNAIPLATNTPIWINIRTINNILVQITDAKAQLVEKDKTIANLDTHLKAYSFAIVEMMNDIANLKNSIADNAERSKCDAMPSRREQIEKETMFLEAENNDLYLTNKKMILELIYTETCLKAQQKNFSGERDNTGNQDNANNSECNE